MTNDRRLLRTRSGAPGRRGRHAALGIGIAVALVLTACGDDDDDAAPEATSGATAAPAATSAPAATTADTAASTDAPAATTEPASTEPASTEPAGEPTGDPIVVGTVTDREVGGGDVTGFVDGAQMWAEETNDNGGLLGRPVEVRTCYADGDPALATACANDFAADEDVLAFVAGGSVVWPSAISPVAERAGMLQIHNGTFSLADIRVPNAFLPIAGTISAFYTLPKYLVENEGYENVAIVRFDIGATTEHAELIQTAAADGGATFVADIPVAPTTTDYLPAVTQAVSQGADLIAAALGPAGTVSLLNAINDGGFTDQVGVIVSDSQASQATVIEAAGEIPIYSAKDNRLLVPGAPGNEEFLATAALYYPERVATDPARLSMGYISGRTFGEIAKLVTGDLSRESVLETSKTAVIELPGYGAPLSLENATAEYPGIALTTVNLTKGNEIFAEDVALELG